MDGMDLLHVLPLPAMVPCRLQLASAAVLSADHRRCQSTAVMLTSRWRATPALLRQHVKLLSLVS
jgi:hypothetical protein